jgi:hypothetical protein
LIFRVSSEAKSLRVIRKMQAEIRLVYDELRFLKTHLSSDG